MFATAESFDAGPEAAMQHEEEAPGVEINRRCGLDRLDGLRPNGLKRDLTTGLDGRPGAVQGRAQTKAGSWPWSRNSLATLVKSSRSSRNGKWPLPLKTIARDDLMPSAYAI